MGILFLFVCLLSFHLSHSYSPNIPRKRKADAGDADACLVRPPLDDGYFHKRREAGLVLNVPDCSTLTGNYTAKIKIRVDITILPKALWEG